MTGASDDAATGGHVRVFGPGPMRMRVAFVAGGPGYGMGCGPPARPGIAPGGRCPGVKELRERASPWLVDGAGVGYSD